MEISNRKGRYYIYLSLLTIVLLTMILSSTVPAKSLYLAANHHTSQFDAWSINPDGTVVKQATYGLHYSTDPSGITIDEDSGVMFITSEFSGGVEMVDPVSLTYIGVSSGPSDLAGIDIDDVDDVVFAVKRYSDDLHIFDWNPAAMTMTQIAQIDLPNCSGAFGLALDEFTDTLWIADTAAGVIRAYDVDVAAWSNIVEIPGLRFTPSHMPVDVAVDRLRNLVYTTSMIGGAWLPPGTGSTLLSQYNPATNVERTVNMGHGGVGIAVDEVTGYVYVTGGANSGDNLSIWNPNTSPFTELQDTGWIGNPAGLAIANISYNPLKLAKNDVIVGEVYIGSTFTYKITYENTNPYDVTNVTIVDTLPPELDFISATDGGIYHPVTHTVLWNVGTVPAGVSGPTIDLVVKVNQNAIPGSTIHNYVTIDGDQIPPTTVIDDEDSEDPDDEPGTPVGESIPVAIDIKPTSCPNPLNVKDNGVLPVAIVGTEDFDVTQVDPASVRLIDVAPLRWAFEDVVTPFEPLLGKESQYDCTEEGPDGYLDLTLKFDTQEIVAALGEVYDREAIVLPLTGNSYEGTPIVGEDVVIILKNQKKEKK
jgi:uncharacterized repeat protein (TIGR01451 family)